MGSPPDRTHAQPDLTAPSFSVAAELPVEGQAFWISQQITNAGSASAGPTHARLYLSMDGDWDVSDDREVLPERSVPALAAGAVSAARWDFSFPNLSGLAEYSAWVVVVVDSRDEVSESSEDNVWLSNEPLLVSGAVLPDLTAPVNRFKSWEAVAGEPFWVEQDITNGGGSTAGSSHARLFLSVDGDWDPSDDHEILPEKPVPAIAPGGVVPTRWDFTFPDLPTSQSGDVWLLVVLDSRNAVVEQDEANFWRSDDPIHLVPSDTPADLTAPWVSFTTWTPTEGETFDVTWEIENSGGRTAPPSHARCYLSVDGDFDVTDDHQILPERSVASVAPGERALATWSFEFPELSGSSTYAAWMLVVLDARDEVPESGEDNIWRSHDSLTVTGASGAPDLTAPFVEALPTSPVEGLPWTLAPLIRNAGTAPAGTSDVRLYLSLDDDWNVADDYELVPAKQVPALAAGAEASASWTFTFPDLAAGTAYPVWVVVQVDSGSAVTESDESNLWKTIDAFQVSPGSGGTPDILVSPLLLQFGARDVATGVSPEPVVLSFRQPGGMTFEGRRRGSPFAKWIEMLPVGWSVRANPETGNYEYLEHDDAGRLRLSGLVVGGADPVAAGLSPGLTPSPAAARAAAARSVSGAPSRAAATGVLRNLVLLANFSDTEPTYGQPVFDDLFNEPGYTGHGARGSVRDYYLEASYGELTVQTTVSPWLQLPRERAYYGANDLFGDDVRPRQMVLDAIQALDASGFDFAPFDGDGDGWVDSFSVIHSGHGEESTRDDDAIWSHKWVLASDVLVDGVKIRAYHTEPELSGSGLVTIGVICHEMGHAFGLPDLYDIDDSSEGVGVWDVMGSGSWNDGGRRPSHFSSWSKHRLGWLEPVELHASADGLELTALGDAAAAYRITQGMAAGESLYVENRHADGSTFDDGLPGGGTIVLHVDESQPDNRNEDRYLVAVLQADGQEHLERHVNRGDAGDPFPGTSGNRALGPETDPSSDGHENGDTRIRLGNISDPGPVTSFDLLLSDGRASLPFTIRNSGTGALAIAALSLDEPAPWITWAPQAPLTIVPGGAVDVVVTVDPDLAPEGTTVRRLLVASNDPDESPYPGGVDVEVTHDTAACACTDRGGDGELSLVDLVRRLLCLAGDLGPLTCESMDCTGSGTVTLADVRCGADELLGR